MNGKRVGFQSGVKHGGKIKQIGFEALSEEQGYIYIFFPQLNTKASKKGTDDVEKNVS